MLSATCARLTRSCGRRGPARLGSTVARSSSISSVNSGSGDVVGSEQPLLLGVALDQVDLGFVAARQAQVAQRLVVDREQRRRRAVLGAHVRDRGAVGQPELAQALAR